jgi:eukaryotic-like serine/threonine-protein kinase
MSAAIQLIEGQFPTRIGPYRVISHLASGGMASVFSAVHERTGQSAAIKRVHPHLAAIREFSEMFRDEADLCARIQHPNVCRVFEAGESTGAYYLAMELLEGLPMGRFLRRAARTRTRTRDPRWSHFVARLIADVCAGVHAAHELVDDDGESLEVVHRDLSPHNVFITESGVAKVFDFGIAKAKARLHHTTTGTVKGKFAYMAPEQVQGRPIDRRADVWAIGVLLWEALALRPLFRRNSEPETILAVIDAPFEGPSAFRPEAAALDAIVLRALCRDVSARTPSAAALRVELEDFLAANGGFSREDAIAWIHEVTIAGSDASVVSAEIERSTTRPVATSRQSGVEHAALSVREATDAAPSISPTAETPRARRKAAAIVAVAFLSCVAALAWVSPEEAPRGTRSIRAPNATAPPVAAAGVASPEVAAVASSPRQPREPPAIEALPPVEPPRSTTLASPRIVAAVDARRAGSVSSATRPPALRPPTPPSQSASVGMGSVDIASPGGWAEVWSNGTRIGHTPGRFQLPEGTHRLGIRAEGRDAERTITVRIVAGQLARVRVDVSQ